MPAPKSLPAVRSGRRSLGVLDAYDALTLTLEQCEVLTVHLAERFDDLLNPADKSDELYALMLVTRHLREKHQLLRAHADALLARARMVC